MLAVILVLFILRAAVVQQEMQPSQTDADPAEWAEGHLQPNLQPPPTEGSTGAAAVNSTGENEPGLSADSDQETSANRNSRPEANGPASGEDMQVDRSGSACR